MKIWKKGLAVLLILVLAISLCACGEKEEDKLIGTWKCEYDMTDFMNQSIASSMGDELTVDAKLVLPMTLTMNQDRSCTLAVNGEEFVASFQTYMDKMMDSLVVYMCESVGMTQEELDAVMQEQYGMNTADYCKQSFAEMLNEEDILEAMEEANSTGTYSVKDGKLVITDEDGNAEESAYTLEGDTLTLDYDGMEIADGLTVDTLTFKKAA